MRLTVIGCGDAFGAGGRLNTCFHVKTPGTTFLIDCGATALIGLRAQGLKPNDIDAVFITHLHGDHFAGLVWLMLDAQYVSKRKSALVVAGPETLEQRFMATAEALYPGSTQGDGAAKLSFVTYQERMAVVVGGAIVKAFSVEHPSGATSYALRLEAGGKAVAFSGDTEWVDNMTRAAWDADLFICECYQYDVKTRYHLDYRTIAGNYDLLGARRVMLTHMGAAMLERTGEVDAGKFILAEDGLVLDL